MDLFGLLTIVIIELCNVVKHCAYAGMLFCLHVIAMCVCVNMCEFPSLRFP